MSETVNFWKYAINEKCQDAFICYLLNSNANPFFKRCHLNTESVIKEPMLQYPASIKDEEGEQHNGHIDIFVETDNHYLIIEDKTGTGNHDKQIVRYIQAIKAQQEKGYLCKKKDIFVCYVKSGYLSKQEKRNIKEELDELFKDEFLEGKNLHFIGFLELCKIAKETMEYDEIIEETSKDGKIVNQWLQENEPIAKLQENFAQTVLDKYNTKDVYDEVFNNPEYSKNKNKINWLRCYLHPYLDTLANEIRKYTVTSEIYSKDTSWSVEGIGYTAHIGLKGTERKKIRNKNCWTSYSLYVMFRQEGPKLVLKQHFYDSQEKGNRIGTKKYLSLGLNKIFEMTKGKIAIPGWETKNGNNEKLMLCEKLLPPTDDLVEVLKAEKENINAIFKAFIDPS